MVDDHEDTDVAKIRVSRISTRFLVVLFFFLSLSLPKRRPRGNRQSLRNENVFGERRTEGSRVSAAEHTEHTC